MFLEKQAAAEAVCTGGGRGEEANAASQQSCVNALNSSAFNVSVSDDQLS